MAEEQWVSVDRVAAHLGVTRDSIYRWIERKGFPAHRVGRLLRFKLSEVDQWVTIGGGAKNSQRKEPSRK
ncbi:MAG: transcriptional regulator [Nitrospiraceae bacterium]|nr:MAG: transcriptional regulator [Nitrospiraceae bacterium]